MVGQTQIPRIVVAAVRDALRRRVQGELVAFQCARAQRGSIWRVVYEGGRIPILEYLISCLEAHLDIASRSSIGLGSL